MVKSLITRIASATFLMLAIVQFCQASVTYTLELTTDDYPEETTWTLTRNGVTIYSGGPYQDDNTLHTEEFTLDSGFCYIFTINDDYGDGICCGYGNGGYTILDETTNEVISGGEFGDQEIQEFCIGFTPCNITTDVVVVNESGPGTMDGSISITASNGTPPYQYSVDGGDSFQPSGMFPNMGVGFYSIVVTDDNDCEHTQTVAIAVISGIDDLSESGLSVYPNPTDGWFSVEVPTSGSGSEFLNVQVLDASGKRIRTERLAIQGMVYKGMISLEEYASGAYFVKWANGRSERMIRVVRK